MFCVVSAYVHPIQVHVPVKLNSKSVLNLDVVEDRGCHVKYPFCS